MFAETTTNGATIKITTDATPKRKPGRPKGVKNKKTQRTVVNRFIKSRDLRDFCKLPQEVQNSILNVITFGLLEATDDTVNFEVED